MTSNMTTLISPQKWKLWLCLAATAAIGLLLFGPATWISEVFGIDGARVVLAMLLGACLLWFAAARSIKCPACSLSLVWHGMRWQPASHWLSWLLDVKACPHCGFFHGRSNHEQ